MLWVYGHYKYFTLSVRGSTLNVRLLCTIYVLFEISISNQQIFFCTDFLSPLYAVRQAPHSPW